MQIMYGKDYKVTREDIDACNELKLESLTRGQAIPEIKLKFKTTSKKANAIYKAWRHNYVKMDKLRKSNIKSVEEEFEVWLKNKESNCRCGLSKEDYGNIIGLFIKGYSVNIILDILKDKNVPKHHLSSLKNDAKKRYFLKEILLNK